MSRLSPLLVRRSGPVSAAFPLKASEPLAGVKSSEWLDDLKLFTTGWIGGLIFFGTFLS